MRLLPLTYRRPSYVSKLEPGHNSGSSVEDKATLGSASGSGSECVRGGIPDALSFDKIIASDTCPPMSLRDFMNFLMYVEHAAENLQFYLWLLSYTQRFEQEDTKDLALAPEWTQAKEDEVMARLQKDASDLLRRDPPNSTDIFSGTDFEKRQPADPWAAVTPGGETDIQQASDPWSILTPAVPGDAFSTPLRTASNISVVAQQPSTGGTTIVDTIRSQANEAFAAAGCKAPFTIQPFRQEIDRVVTTYIREGAPRELNLSDRDRKAVLHALASTTHPSAFRIVFHQVDAALRRQHHPNFVRWSICNGNPARVLFARSLGVFLIVAGTAVATVLTISRAGRAWRALAAIAWLLGVATLVAAYKGMCVVLHGLHHHHVRPWELFEEEEEGLPGEDELRKAPSLDSSFGSSNSFEHEPWVERYQERNVIRKIFDRETYVKEKALRQIQDTIFVQSILVGLAGAGILTALFMPLPAGNLF